MTFRLRAPLALLAGTTLALVALVRAGPVLPLGGDGDPLVATFALLRVAALVLGGYVLATTATGTAAHVASCPRLATAIERVSLPVVRRAVGQVAVATLLASGSVAAPALAASAETASTTAPASPPPVLRRLDEAPLAPTTSPPPVLRLVPPPTSPTSTTTKPPEPPAVEPPPEPVAPELTPPVPDPFVADEPEARSWTIAPGDHLWHVAQTTLTGVRGRPPSDAETLGYLGRLVDANAAVLAVPGHPDLVFPGQVFTLPDP